MFAVLPVELTAADFDGVPLAAAVIKPFALTVMLALVNDPTLPLTVARVKALEPEVLPSPLISEAVKAEALPRISPVRVFPVPVPPLATGTTENVAVGVDPAPPPNIKFPAVKAPEEAQVDAEEKYGMPPEVPATVNAGVVVGLATDIKPPVKDTLDTLPELGRSAATKARKVGAAAEPVAGPAKTRLADWVLSEAFKVPVLVTGALGVLLRTVPSPVKVTLETPVPIPMKVTAGPTELPVPMYKSAVSCVKYNTPNGTKFGITENVGTSKIAIATLGSPSPDAIRAYGLARCLLYLVFPSHLAAQLAG
jgi:hypothetical protein